MSIDSYEDIIDSREVIARIAQLAVIREPGPVEAGILDPDDEDCNQDDLFHELAALEALNEEGKSFPDWEYGVTLVRDSYFQDYARNLAEEIGAISGDEQWPANCIDWEKAAWELRMDYTSVEFDGVTYWAR